MRFTNLRQLASATFGLLLLALGGCSSLEPWVKPYERAALADEVMSTDRTPLMSDYANHMNQAREASRGGRGSAGGGCGCN